MRRYRIGLVLMGWSILTLRALSSTAGQTSTMQVDGVYEAIMDRVFPAVAQASVPVNSRNIVLKFGGTDDTEAQILVYGLGSKEEKYEIWRVPKRSPSILRQSIDLRKQLRTEDPDLVASYIVIEHRVIRQPTEKVLEVAKQILLPNFPLAADDGITTEGIYYSFYMKSISNHTHIELIGPTGEYSRHPLIKWMSAMRAALEGQLDSARN